MKIGQKVIVTGVQTNIAFDHAIGIIKVIGVFIIVLILKRIIKHIQNIIVHMQVIIFMIVMIWLNRNMAITAIIDLYSRSSPDVKLVLLCISAIRERMVRDEI